MNKIVENMLTDELQRVRLERDEARAKVTHLQTQLDRANASVDEVQRAHNVGADIAYKERDKVFEEITMLRRRISDLERRPDTRGREARDIAISERNAAVEVAKGLTERVVELEAKVQRLRTYLHHWRTSFARHKNSRRLMRERLTVAEKVCRLYVAAIQSRDTRGSRTNPVRRGAREAALDWDAKRRGVTVESYANKVPPDYWHNHTGYCSPTGRLNFSEPHGTTVGLPACPRPVSYGTDVDLAQPFPPGVYSPWPRPRKPTPHPGCRFCGYPVQPPPCCCPGCGAP